MPSAPLPSPPKEPSAPPLSPPKLADAPSLETAAPQPPLVEPKSASKPAVPVKVEEIAQAIQEGRKVNDLLGLEESGEDWC